MELMERVLTVGVYGEPRETAREVVQGLLKLYAAAPGLHRVLALEGLRVTPTERVKAFDMRVVSVIRSFLAVSKWPVRRHQSRRGCVCCLSRIRVVASKVTVTVTRERACCGCFRTALPVMLLFSETPSAMRIDVEPR
jgi:hypothetical protein